MKMSRFSEQQIAFILKQAGRPFVTSTAVPNMLVSKCGSRSWLPPGLKWLSAYPCLAAAAGVAD
jgi:hypothetical protein